MESYRRSYFATLKAMEDSLDEEPFECSLVFIFTQMNTFIERLTKVYITNFLYSVKSDLYCYSFSYAI